MADANVVAAFDEDYAARLSGVSKRQLSYWFRSGFFVPAHVEEGRAAFSRIYSFRDIVALKVLNMLRNHFRVSLQHLREVKEKLNHLEWTGVRLYVVKGGVVWMDPETARPQEILSGQYIVPIILDDVISNTRNDLEKIAGRDEKTIGKIDRSRYINHNAPVISGTRIRVSAIKAFYDAGYSIAQIIEEYPDLTEDDIQAALSYKKAA
jgi:uncharacterized protein (DUF433 family)